MPRKLLLADDSVTIQRVIELTFADEDIQVVAVGDGQQAIARIDTERPDVVLADVGMPGRDGYEVAAHIKENPQTAHIPVLLLTGAFEPIDEARARAVGCDGVLVKPFEPQMVINRVKDLLAGRRPTSLWATQPGPTGAVVTPQAGAGGPLGIVGGLSAPRADQAAQQPAQPGRADSLDDYFDRLDAAFSDVETTPASRVDDVPPAPPAPPALPEPAPRPISLAPAAREEFGTWDSPGERKPGEVAVPLPETPAPAIKLAQPSAPAIESVPTIAPESGPAGQAPELADAFAALLAAEQQFAASPALAGTGPRTPVDEGAMEETVRRVLARMTEDQVKATVLDVAERLVRAEIDKIKQQAKL